MWQRIDGVDSVFRSYENCSSPSLTSESDRGSIATITSSLLEDGALSTTDGRINLLGGAFIHCSSAHDPEGL